MFSLESPHRGDSKEYIRYTIFNMKKNIYLSSQIPTGFFLGTQERVRKSGGKRVTRVRTSEGLVYFNFLPL